MSWPPQRTPHRREAAPMDLGRPETPEQGEVLRRRIALVPVEAVAREAVMHPAHFGVPRRLGEDGGGRNRRMQPVSLDDGTRRARQPGTPVAIDPGFIRRHAQPLHRALHGEQRGLQDVQAVYFFDGGMSDRTRNGLFEYLYRKKFSFSFTQEF